MVGGGVYVDDVVVVVVCILRRMGKNKVFKLPHFYGSDTCRVLMLTHAPDATTGRAAGTGLVNMSTRVVVVQCCFVGCFVGCWLLLHCSCCCCCCRCFVVCYVVLLFRCLILLLWSLFDCCFGSPWDPAGSKPFTPIRRAYARDKSITHMKPIMSPRETL